MVRHDHNTPLTDESYNNDSKARSVSRARYRRWDCQSFNANSTKGVQTPLHAHEPIAHKPMPPTFKALSQFCKGSISQALRRSLTTAN
ncbi:hypothetical protein BJP36_39360 [Moorena producens JHB]|uniref:Uncharacterized protein n=1 Tax=Moorena producens (strain JHB) TaxID=1454205 RepID=A0A9Q9UWP7_MOOP1|nr:hypothetical protein [Moorena producens]WAN70114.1 hypothetical protein BJP36_39360 [Moorena producens JHB]